MNCLGDVRLADDFRHARRFQSRCQDVDRIPPVYRQQTGLNRVAALLGFELFAQRFAEDVYGHFERVRELGLLFLIAPSVRE
jgi:hypothetical protein